MFKVMKLFPNILVDTVEVKLAQPLGIYFKVNFYII